MPSHWKMVGLCPTPTCVRTPGEQYASVRVTGGEGEWIHMMSDGVFGGLIDGLGLREKGKSREKGFKLVGRGVWKDGWAW